ncbi:lytic transglycosylase domain-containing protein [Chitinophaga tropicalis]|uniref:Transglycosylase SLT domain-containing protein n=1 Tax=Chitinophaga tropicalis TaxID=2683588 RepID=A0A7K1UEW1_9BACT|nr:lytic transglycosylase domain-containing protein [Chitinophaga tropicalis]MVT12515.1 transglycosylase SLT domain-containing protein [Chitinophaga tropicalis]
MRTLVLIFAVLPIMGVNGQDLSFCGERVPVEQESVKKRLIVAINKNSKELSNERLRGKMELYIPYISIVLQQYQLPDDLKFIAVAESRLRRGAQSSAGAAGVWQFMPKTAVGEGLEASERNMVIKSTHAACRLLDKLYNQLHSWPLVVAAYNFGIGNVTRAIKKQGTNDYYALRLNEETGNYLYEILSFKILYRQALAKGVGDKAPGGEQAPRQLPGLPPLPSLPAVAGSWHKSGFFQNASFETDTLSQLTAETKATDTLLIPASIVKDSYIHDTGELAFNTHTSVQLKDFTLNANTTVKGSVYSRAGNRAHIVIEGIDIAPQLRDYSGLICAADGREGLPTGSARGTMVFSGGSRVQIKLMKE